MSSDFSRCLSLLRQALNVMDCIECGSCNYICPARLHLVQSFRVTKGELRALAAKEKAAKEAAKA